MTAMDAMAVRSDLMPCETCPMNSEFWGRLIAAFEDAGMETSQSAIARHLEIGQSAVAKWAHGAGYPTLRKCIQIANLTGVSVEWLLTGRGNKRQQAGAMDELTQALLERWADLPADAKREILEFVEFRASKSQDTGRGPPGPARGRKE